MRTKFIAALALALGFSPLVLNAHSGELFAGTAWEDVTPPIGTPLGGYGGPGRRLKSFVDWFGKYPYTTFFNPSVGVYDPIRSKAMVVKKDGKTLLFVSLDAVGITADFYHELNSRLKPLGFDHIFISATHTHSGPGALSRSWFWEIIAMDKFNREVYDGFTEGIVTSIEKAYSSLEPAELFTASFDAPELHHNRRGHAGHADDRANLLLARSKEGHWLGGIVNYAVHGVALDDDNLNFSADVPGGIEHELETALAAETGSTRKPTVLFVNGAEGDVSPEFGGLDGIKKTGLAFAEKAMSVLPLAHRLEPKWSVRELKIPMPRGRLDTRKCGIKIKKRDIDMKIWIGNRALPPEAWVFQVDLDGITLMTWPGEPTTSVGFETKAIARAHGRADPWVFGLTNGHMGYFTTVDEYYEGGYEPCVTMHGPRAAEKILDAHEKLLSLY